MDSIFSRSQESYDEHKDLLKWIKADPHNPLACIAQIIRSGTVLDIGCGAGLLGRVLHDNTPSLQVDGIDPAIQSGHVGLSGYRRFISLPLEHVLHEEWIRVYDWYVFADVLEHFAYPDVMLRQLVTTSGAEAKFVISVPNIGHISTRLDLLFGDWCYTQSGILESTHLRFFTLDTLSKVLNSAGLYLEKVFFLNRFLSPSIFHQIGLARSVAALMLMGARAHPAAYQFVVVASKKESSQIEYEHIGSASRFEVFIKLFKAWKIGL